ncbi:MAG: hypothetical protein GY761_20695 [Hyphomicrobiales bacterium]|nr:hypothetical protein [Hyphomicrobiales bacterium]
MILTSPIDLSPLLQSPETISAKDVLIFRRELFRDGLISKHEADAVFMINEASENQCSEWHEFFVEVLADFAVDQMEPRGYISVENGEWLVRQMQRDGNINVANELELLVRTIEKASDCPDFLVNYVLEQVTRLVITGEGELLSGEKITKGVIGKAEAELLRRVIYAVSSENSIAISRKEAEVLFELNDKTTQAQNHPAWHDLFVKAIANHLMAVSGYAMPDRQTAFAREEWLNDTEIDVAGTLKKALSSFSSLFKNGGLDQIFTSDGQRVEQDWGKRNAEFDQKNKEAVVIDRGESHWIVDRIGRDGVIHENEKAIVQFLKDESPEIHPSLQPLLDKVV